LSWGGGISHLGSGGCTIYLSVFLNFTSGLEASSLILSLPDMIMSALGKRREGDLAYVLLSWVDMVRPGTPEIQDGRKIPELQQGVGRAYSYIVIYLLHLHGKAIFSRPGL
jgi:hypothetical protein